MSTFQDLVDHGAVTLRQHFVYTNGDHGDAYIDMDWLFPHKKTMRLISTGLVMPLMPLRDTSIEVVAAPGVGGIALVSDVWEMLCEWGQSPLRVWADKEGADFRFARAGFASLIKGRRVLVVEDFVNTGGTVSKVCQQVEQCGGEVVAVSTIVNRGRATSEQLGWELLALETVDFNNYPANDCPLCRSRDPIVVDVGHGAKFREANPGYAGGWMELHAA